MRSSCTSDWAEHLFPFIRALDLQGRNRVASATRGQDGDTTSHKPRASPNVTQWVSLKTTRCTSPCLARVTSLRVLKPR